jgi:multicomponent Na+:H+ antiporter subunit F
MTLAGYDLMAVATWVALVLLFSALVCAFVRLVKGPDPPDRVMALDMIAIIIVGVCAIYAIKADEALFLRVAIVITLVNFLATIAIARYLSEKAL